MTGDALPHFPGAEPLDPALLRLFAAVLLCRPHDSDDPITAAMAVRAQTSARRALDTGRAPAEGTRIAPYVALYAEHRTRAAAIRAAHPTSTSGPAWERALAALATLRHRQRSALALRYVVGLSDRETAEVLGTRELETRRVVDGAVLALTKTVGDRIDIRRALRKAGARLQTMGPGLAPASSTGAAPSPEAAATEGPRRETGPRPVVRLLLSPESAAAPRPHVARNRLIAAVAALIFTAVLVPVSAHLADWSARPVLGVTHPPGATWQTPRTISAPAPVVATAAQVTVRPGDSLWAIAGRSLGDPHRWTQIWRANRNAAMPGGERFTDPNLIKPGWVLRLPRSG